MTIGEWIGIVGLALLYGSAMLGFWFKIKLKCAELDIRLDELESDMEKRRKWGDDVLKAETEKTDIQFRRIIKDNHAAHEKLGEKLDELLSALHKFQLYVEKSFKKD